MNLLGDRLAHVAITGASTGIGAALAEQYASPGRRLSLLGRRTASLYDIAGRCEKLGASVDVQQRDVRDADEIALWYLCIERHQPVDVLIVNAGIFDGHGPDDALETPSEARDLVNTNLLGAIHTAQAALPHMMARKRGHIAFVSSLAARLPSADAPTYSASKAGLAAYAEALREFLLDYNVTISTIYPGHVGTAQTELHIGPLPLIISPTDAARRIRRALDRGQTHLAFPRRAAWLVAASRCLPWRLRARTSRGSRFKVRKT
ncbi:SDR family NAD(P)-dependent oxidoreductase [Leptospira interrogans]